MGLLEGKVALVTGATRGIGRAIALRFAAEGADVAFTYRSQHEAAAGLTSELETMGVRAHGFASDAASFDDAHAVVAAVHAEFGRIDILVATDIVSRGIDIDDIRLVINYDAPRDCEDYVHRIGRTARAGADGCAITFVSVDDQSRFAAIEEFIGREVFKLPLPAEVGEGPEYNPKKNNGRPKGHRNRKNGHRNEKSSSGNHGKPRNGKSHRKGNRHQGNKPQA